MNITNAINSKLKKEQEDRKDRVSSGKISPSGFGKCWRYQIWKRQGKEPTNPHNARTLRIFSVGKRFHEWVQGLLGEVQSEVKVEMNDILGFADLVTEDEVIDIKSQHSKGFWWMNQKGYDITKGKYGDILQVTCYAWILGKPKARLFYLSKDDLCTEEHVFFTDKWTEKVEKELVTLRALWKSGITPNAEPRTYKTECIQKNGTKPCLFYGYCKEELCTQSKT